MALCIQTPCSLQWRLDELDKIIDSMENEIEAAITQQQIQTGHDYTMTVWGGVFQGSLRCFDLTKIVTPSVFFQQKQNGKFTNPKWKVFRGMPPIRTAERWPSAVCASVPLQNLLFPPGDNPEKHQRMLQILRPARLGRFVFHFRFLRCMEC